MILSNKIASAFCWSGLDYFARFAISFIVTIVLSRILSPEEFGLIALLSLFVALGSAISDGGMTSALIQSQNITDDDFSTVFWFNILVGFGFACVLLLMSSFISYIFNHSELSDLTKILSLNVIINAFASVHSALLTKKFNFEILMKVNIASIFISGVVGISLALLGYGVWSLVGQSLVSSTMSTILLWYFNPWRPGFVFNLNSIIKLMRFGGFICVADVCELIYNKIYVAILGGFYGFSQLGLFHRAYALQQVPVNIISGVIDRISFSLFSCYSGEVCKLKEQAQLFIKMTMFFCVPIMFGLIGVSDIVIIVVLGNQWLDCIPIFQILCFAGVLWPMHIVNLAALKAQGYSAIFLKIDFLKKLIGITILLISSMYGVNALALGIVLVSIVSFIINTHYTDKMLDYGIFSQIKDVCPFFFVSSLMSGFIYYFKFYLNIINPIKLFVLMVVGGFVYLLIGLSLRLSFFKSSTRYILGKIDINNSFKYYFGNNKDL